MNTHMRVWLLALCAAVLAMTGCRRNIVSAAPPSVATPPQPTSMPQPIPAEPLPETAATPAPEPEPSVPATSPVRVAPPPRPAPVEAEPAKPKVEPEPPQISPQMTPAQLAEAQRRTTDDIRVAERNLQRADGKRLNAPQNDLVEKIRGFLAQAHEAVRANDWVRARNLSQKAQVLSVELVKSL